MKLYYRHSTQLTKWWFSLDHTIIFTMLVILLTGILMVFSSSPAIALKNGFVINHYDNKHIFWVFLFLIIVFSVTIIDVSILRKLSFIALLMLLVMMIWILFFSNEVKGAKRWISLVKFSFQPSEFLKPFFIIINAWFLSRYLKHSNKKGYFLSFCLFFMIIIPLIFQPDIGMSIIFTIIWLGQLFLSGIPVVIIFLIISIFTALSYLIYINFPHVKFRLDKFLFNDSPTYQVEKSLDAIEAGGLFGKGLFEGKIKLHLPDAHTDFIFAVLVEELGIIMAIGIIILYLIIIIRIFIYIHKSSEMYQKLIFFGIMMQLTTQIFINVGVNINLLPTKGTTLPLISYGGSSMLSTAIIFGVLLQLSRDRFGKKLYSV